MVTHRRLARPSVVVNAYAAAAADLGREVKHTHSLVVGIDQVGDGRVAVRTRDGRVYTTPTVICTCGAWSKQIAAMVDVELPIEPLRRQIVFTAPMQPRPPGWTRHHRLLQHRLLPRQR